jgi:hypothetical protein
MDSVHVDVEDGREISMRFPCLDTCVGLRVHALRIIACLQPAETIMAQDI